MQKNQPKTQEQEQYTDLEKYPQKEQRKTSYGQLLFAVLLVLLLVYGKIDKVRIEKSIISVSESISAQGVFYQTLVLMVLYIVLEVMMFSVVPMNIFFGYLFNQQTGYPYGILLGTIIIFASFCVGSTIAYYLAKCGLQNLIKTQLKQRIQRLQKVSVILTNYSPRILVILRMCPGIPVGVLNNLIGGLGMPSFHNFISYFGMLPKIIAYCYIGSLLKSMTMEDYELLQSTG